MNLSKLLKNGIIGSILFFPAVGLAGQVTITNAFSAGSPARADEVNQNFTDVKTAVDDNDSRITANSNDISTNADNITINTDDIDLNTANIGSNTSRITISEQDIINNASAISSIRPPVYRDSLNNILGMYLTRYMFQSSKDIGMTSTGLVFTMWLTRKLRNVDIGFVGANCSGDVYITSDSIIPNSVPAEDVNYQGYLFRNNAEIYYMPKNSILVSSITIASYIPASGVCTNGVAIFNSVYQVYPNDPVITGVDNGVIADGTFSLGF